MDEIEIFGQLGRVDHAQVFTELFDGDAELARRVSEHLSWLHMIRHELPNPAKHFKIGIYIRFFNQTKYDNYLSKHVALFRNTLALCPNWELVDFYVDKGASPPHMESAPEWCRLLNDCYAGKVDLIITQKMSNVSKKPTNCPSAPVCWRRTIRPSGSISYPRICSRLLPTTNMTCMSLSFSPRTTGRYSPIQPTK